MSNPVRGLRDFILRMTRHPLGFIGLNLTTISGVLLVFFLGAAALGKQGNPYLGIVTFLVLPGIFFFGLALMPIGSYLYKRKARQRGEGESLFPVYDLNRVDVRSRLLFIGVMTVLNLSLCVVLAMKGIEFMDSVAFCGQTCHPVMKPEFTVYQGSPHARVRCVDCHIGPGASWFVKSKLSGTRQVFKQILHTWPRPVETPVESLRPSRDTCEECHWPDKFHGKKVKSVKHYSNNNQTKPTVTDIALHIGGRNPETNAFEGIHWHISKGIEIKYLAVDDKRTQIAKVSIKKADGSTDEFVKADLAIPAEMADKWRVMDCTDCHSRPTHVYDMPEDVVDFGLGSKKINGAIPGIREDSFKTLTAEYKSRDEAKKNLGPALLALQSARNPQLAAKNKSDIEKAGAYLVEGYLNNIWPSMKVTWGTYQSHIGHRSEDFGGYKYADTKFGCFRCHDEEHTNKAGKTITQNCGNCHDEPK